MSKIESLFGQFKNNEEREQFMQSQHQVITNLTKKTEEQVSKIKHLEAMLKDAVKPESIILDSTPVTNEELIAREQIHMLKIASAERELTLEETRKLDTYVKIILSLKDTQKKPASSVANLDAKALLKLVEEPG